MLSKEQVLKSIQDLPEQFSVEEIIDRIILLYKIDIGIQQSNAQQTFSTDEAKEKLRKWLP